MARDRARHRAYQKAWYEKNKNVLSERRRKRYATDVSYKASRLLHASVWSERYPEKRKRSSSICGYLERERLKIAVVNVLTNGEGTCRWCGQGDIDVLCIDHIEDNGAAHRETIGGTSIYRWIVKNDYPDGFQVLCYNCNRKKQALYIKKTRTYA